MLRIAARMSLRSSTDTANIQQMLKAANTKVVEIRIVWLLPKGAISVTIPWGNGEHRQVVAKSKRSRTA
jgi:hypothetical protein